jgi:hypothetical protein
VSVNLLLLNPPGKSTLFCLARLASCPLAF